MKNLNKLLISLFIVVISMFTFDKVNATKLSYSGDSNVVVGESIKIQVKLTDITNGPITTVGAKVTYDSSYLSVSSASGASSPFDITFNQSTMKMAGVAFSGKGITSSQTVATITFKAKKVGSVKLGFSDIQIGNKDGAVSVSTSSKTITVVEPPSKNNYLKTLTVSQGSLSFNKNTTSYKVSVAENVTSININATAEDSAAKISGTGTKKLSYGDNKFNIVVTAESGDKKTYTVTVNRKDNRSTNNKLSSLKVAEGNFSPSFSASTTNYTMTVPYSVSKLTVTAKATDTKAKVSISGQNNLKAEETQNVTIKVTAENGSTKNYVIKVTREKDPNKKLSNDNNLSSLVPSTGTLSPVFSRDVTDYTLTVPFSTKTITFDAKASDAKYGKVKVDGPANLVVGNNKFTITVTAEDSTTKTYNVVVTREKDPNYVSTSIYLKELKLTKGTLDKPFDKLTNVYRYNKEEGITISEAIPEEEESKVVIHQNADIYTIYVEAGTGDSNTYVFIPEEQNKSNSLIYIITCAASLLLIIISSIISYRIGLRRDTIKKIKMKY